MSNAWRVLLGLQALRENHNVHVSIESLQYSYYFKIHDHEKGRIQINQKPCKEALIHVPSTRDPNVWKERYFLVSEAHVFGSDGPGDIPLSWRPIGTVDDRTHFEKEYLTKKFVKGILGVSASKRSTNILLSPESLARTSIWSSCIAELKVSKEVFVRRFRFMGKSKTCGILDIDDLLKGVEVDRKRTKRLKKLTARASSTADGQTEGLPLSSTPLLKSVDDLDVRKIGDVTLNVEPLVFIVEGHFELLEDAKFCEGSLSRESDRLVAQTVKNLHAAVLMDKDIISMEQ